MGFGRASGLALSGEILSGEKAYEAGLVDRLVDPDELLDQAPGLGATIAANASPQLRMTKQLFALNASETDLGLVPRRERALLSDCWKSPEHAEAVAAFIEKRPNMDHTIRRSR